LLVLVRLCLILTNLGIFHVINLRLNFYNLNKLIIVNVIVQVLALIKLID